MEPVAGGSAGPIHVLVIPKGNALKKMKNYITFAGAEALKIELKKLLHQDRPELVKVISWAASNGDRSENGDYIYGKRRLREIDRRIHFLTQRLQAAEIVQPSTLPLSRVLFGVSVTVLDEKGRKRTFRIVGQDEIDLHKGWVSWVSPIARALLNARVGDVVQFKSPQGIEDLEVLEISSSESSNHASTGNE